MHARPAAKIAEMTMGAKGNIWLSDGVSTVDASSIIDILTLCAVTGTRISIHVENKGDTLLAEELKAFFDMGFGEQINE
ncbi:MAG: HPr family phosphocarrier protein [Desulfobacter sp.]|nr:MAG: HPr family phosphocarrier protein [Desulfobacter sp.]